MMAVEHRPVVDLMYGVRRIARYSDNRYRNQKHIHHQLSTCTLMRQYLTTRIFFRFERSTRIRKKKRILINYYYWNKLLVTQL